MDNKSLKKVVKVLNHLQSSSLPQTFTIGLITYRTGYSPETVERIFNWIEEIDGIKRTGLQMVNGRLRMAYKVNPRIINSLLFYAPDLVEQTA